MNWIFAKIREWFILIFGLVVVVGGLLLASYIQIQPSPALNGGGESLTQDKPADGSKPQASLAPHAQSAAPIPSKGNDKTAPALMPTAPTASHNHATTTQPQPVVQSSDQSKKQASSAAAPASAPVSGSRAVLNTQAAAGQQVYRKCQACHSLEPGKNGLGPTLNGIVGEKAGHVSNYNYSPAMKNSGLTWDAATLNAYLTDPQKTVPGNKMPFPGLKTENERSAVIAYLTAPSGAAPSASPSPSSKVAATPAPTTQQAPTAPAQSKVPPPPSYLPGIRYTLKTGIAEGRMVFIGVGGNIDEQINPLLSAAEGQVVQVTLVNGEGAEHDIVFADQGPAGSSPHITGRGASTNIAFVPSKAGDYIYYCSVPGHQLAGMQGQFLITPQPPASPLVEADISLRSTEVPAPIGKREPQTVRVDLVTVELEGRLAEGTTFGYWTFNGKVPGPMLRVRVGDTVDVHLKNADASAMVHSVDFHAATGPGGGAAATQTNPGDTKSFKFKALIPGLYVYHCATPMVAHHIANGMYGMILVEPEGGLPPVDREFYVMQGEIYTEAPFGQHGSQEFNVEKLLNERPEYFVFNGSVGALSKLHPLQAKVGETIRIFFGVGGPNFTSSFHLIGEIFDKVYNLGGVLSEPLRGVQTVTVPAGGAVITEVKLDVPGNYVLVDHALSRVERGLVGILHVEGAVNSEIFDGKVEPGSGH